MPDTATVLTTIGSSAVVSALLQLVGKYFSDRELSRERTALDSRLESFRTALQQQTNALTAEQTRVTNRLQTTFSALQTERSAAVKELYARIVRVETILNQLAVTKMITDDSVSRYESDVAAFIDYFLPNRIWLPSTVSTQISELRSLFGSFQKALASAPRNVRVTAEFQKGLVVLKGATANALEDVSASFRALLGAEST